MITNAQIAAPAEKEKLSFRGVFWVACVGATLVFWGTAAVVIWRLM